MHSLTWRRLHPLLFAAVALLPVPVFGQSIISRKLSGLVESADQIFVGQCTQKEFLIRNGTIITRYTLRPSEMIKGTMSAAQQGNIIVEEPGGESPNPLLPIGALVPGTSRLTSGEEVLLFTTKPKTNNQLAALHARSAAAQKQVSAAGARSNFDPDAFRIVGLNQGYYSVITNHENGKKMVMHGATPEMLRVKSAQTSQATTATQATINKFMAATLRKKLAEQNRQKLSAKEQPDKIQPFALLDDVRTQIAQTMQKSK